MQIAVDEPMKQTIDYFDRARKKRHRVMYDEPGLVTEKETQQLIKKATEFLEYIWNIYWTQVWEKIAAWAGKLEFGLVEKR